MRAQSRGDGALTGDQTPQPPLRSQHRWRGPGGVWAYDLWGGTGRPILLLHGPTFDRRVWWPVAAELAAHATVIAVDLPGYGETRVRAGCRPQDVVEDLALLVHHLGRRRAPVVVGHHRSALLAAMFATGFAAHVVVCVDQVFEVAEFHRTPRVDRRDLPVLYQDLVPVPDDGDRTAADGGWLAGQHGELTQQAITDLLPGFGTVPRRLQPAATTRIPGLADPHNAVRAQRRVWVPQLTATGRFAADLRSLG